MTGKKTTQSAKKKTTKLTKDIDSFILYSRDGDIQGVITSLLTSGETIIHLSYDHNHRISLETLEKWVKQARKYDNKMNKVLASADKASSILASVKKHANQVAAKPDKPVKAKSAKKKTTKSTKKQHT